MSCQERQDNPSQFDLFTSYFDSQDMVGSQGLIQVSLGDPLIEGLILAQDERWRRALGMQVERAYLRIS